MFTLNRLSGIVVTGENIFYFSGSRVGISRKKSKKKIFVSKSQLRRLILIKIFRFVSLQRARLFSCFVDTLIFSLLSGVSYKISA